MTGVIAVQVGSQAFQATVEALQLPMLIAKCVVYIGTSSAVVMSAGMFAVKVRACRDFATQRLRLPGHGTMAWRMASLAA